MSWFKDLPQDEKDEIIRAMKNPNVQEAYLSDKGDPDVGVLDAVVCRETELYDSITNSCKSAMDIYNYESLNQNIAHDVNIDVFSESSKYTKRQIIDELEEFKIQGIAKELINMTHRDKIDELPDAKKRSLVWADYWINRYKRRGIK